MYPYKKVKKIVLNTLGWKLDLLPMVKKCNELDALYRVEL
jgi:hypothetical protein